MQRRLNVGLVSLVVLALLAGTSGVSALPCCNNYGYLLCNPESPMWDHPLWSWFNGTRDITITVWFCYEISCEEFVLEQEPVHSCQMPRELSPIQDLPEALFNQ